VHFDKIVFKPIPDGPTAAAALKAGDLQALDSISPSELSGVQQTSSLRVLETSGLGWRGIIINIGNSGNGPGNPPYTNVGTPLASSPALRQAFEEAIDRSALNKVVFDGTTQTGCTPFAPASQSFDASIRCTPYDPADARKLVARSGIANPTVHWLTTTATDNVRLAQFLQAEEAAVGINVVIDTVDSATVAANVASGNFDTMLAGPASGANPDVNFYRYFASSGSSNFGGYSNPRLDLILSNTRNANTPAALRTLYHAAQQILIADRPAIILYHSARYAGVRDDVAGVQQFSADLVLRVAFAQYK
jgi:peptide/nickel transport system substrate-binding protein